MITQLAQSHGNTIGVSVSGKIDLAEENRWIGIFDELVKTHGKINILVQVDGKIDYELNAVYEDLKWTFKHLAAINKLAIVSDSKVLGMLVAADSPFAKLVNISEKHFETEQLADAWDWVKQA